MRVLIDADGCPVVDEAVGTAKDWGAQAVILCDTSHVFGRGDARVVTVSKGPDSVDFALANLAGKGDICVTQDYGLAAMCLARGAAALNQDGMEYTAENIDALLLSRHTAKKIRRGGGRLKGPPKRTAEQNTAFVAALTALLRRKRQEE